MIEKIDNEPREYGKFFIKIKLNWDGNLPFVRSVFEEDGKYHPQVFLDECLYEL